MFPALCQKRCALLHNRRSVYSQITFYFVNRFTQYKTICSWKSGEGAGRVAENISAAAVTESVQAQLYTVAILPVLSKHVNSKKKKYILRVA